MLDGFDEINDSKKDFFKKIYCLMIRIILIKNLIIIIRL